MNTEKSMNTLNVSVKKIGEHNEFLEITFQCSKELLSDFNGWMPLDTAIQFGQMLLEEVTEVLKEEKRRDRGE
jgi:hypothetical protein